MAKESNSTKKIAQQLADIHTKTTEIKEVVRAFVADINKLYKQATPEAKLKIKPNLSEIVRTGNAMLGAFENISEVMNITYFKDAEDTGLTQESVQESVEISADTANKDKDTLKTAMDVAEKENTDVKITTESKKFIKEVSLAELLNKGKNKKVIKEIKLDQILNQSKKTIVKEIKLNDFLKTKNPLAKQINESNEIMSGFGMPVSQVGFNGVDNTLSPMENLDKYGFVVTKRPSSGKGKQDKKILKKGSVGKGSIEQSNLYLIIYKVEGGYNITYQDLSSLRALADNKHIDKNVVTENIVESINNLSQEIGGVEFLFGPAALRPYSIESVKIWLGLDSKWKLSNKAVNPKFQARRDQDTAEMDQEDADNRTQNDD